MEKECISVIIPVYNLEKCLERAVDSVLNQTYRNVEVLLVDDGSTDGSGALCDVFARQDCRVRVIHRPNGGVSAARNTGLDSAKGEYVCFVDGDDWIEPGMLAFLHNLLQKYQADLAMCGFIEEEEGGSVIRRTKPFETREISREMAFHCYKPYMQGYACTKLFRMDIIQTASLRFDVTLKIKEDTVFLYQYIFQCGKLVSSGDIYYHYMTREDSAMRASFHDGKLTERDASRIIIDMLSGYPKSRRIAKNRYIDLDVQLLMNMLKADYHNPEAEKQMVREIRRSLPWYLFNPWSAFRYRVFAVFFSISVKIMAALYGARSCLTGQGRNKETS